MAMSPVQIEAALNVHAYLLQKNLAITALQDPNPDEMLPLMLKSIDKRLDHQGIENPEILKAMHQYFAHLSKQSAKLVSQYQSSTHEHE